MAPELYREWEHYREMDRLVRNIHRVISSEQLINYKHIASKATYPLLSTHEQALYGVKLDSMIRKIHKEETEKALLEEQLQSK
ncbi:hypothetical protein JNUCC42_07425 [Brevibacterium sp. JNUCC-42]|nr:hypothetical protein JNUCC42_07425 [Brevibacterium sp. JNUCC-42]